ncbi:hypothetical protein FOMG_17453 [Fusarium oxysporum f. sp. melonis 26406]|uniref:Major facilitator superfamily (MFS) profile domain-containing protein n=1 Tax=Fusarium oxysporum f. sp. melonis 26406 TaxID=1089452 RepID=W9Z2A6_FUSOX|nr:hypothetical protein FOMG_17453 [Fusarium oxysporum f. sp. melonis 26406]
MTSKLDGLSFQDSRTPNHWSEILLQDQLPEAANQDAVLDTFDETFRVEFEDDHDPFSPRNMPLLNKWLIVMVVCTATICVTCTSSIYTTTYTQLERDFSATRISSVLGLSTFVLGIAFGPLLTGPLSEHYGRRLIYLVSWSMFLIWTIPSALAQNMLTLIITRFFNGFFGSAFLSVAGGTVGDIFSRDQLQRPMVLVSLAPFIGPSIGPLLGGFINSYLHWRWTYYLILVWATILLIGVAFVPETFHPIVLKIKARKLRSETGDDRYWASGEQMNKTRWKTVALTLMRPFQLFFLEPMCLCLNLYSATLLGILYLFFGTLPQIFRTNHGMNLWQSGLTFLGIIAGMIVAAATNPVWIRIRFWLLDKHKGTRAYGHSHPEYQLPPAIAGGALIPIGLFWFAWTTQGNVHWLVPVMGSSLFGCGLQRDIYISGRPQTRYLIEFQVKYVTVVDKGRFDVMAKNMIVLHVSKPMFFYEAEGIEQRRETPPDISQYATNTGYPLQNAALSISPTRARTPRRLPFQPSAQGTILTTAPSSSGHQTSTAQVNEPVIGHMGRLVADDRQAPMFGGSTTGVHFISQAEQQLQLFHMHKDALPSCAYGLYLHSPWGASVHSPASPVVDIIAQLPPNTIEIVEATIDRWTPLYPIVHKSSTIDAIHGLLSSYQSRGYDVVILYQTLALLALGMIGQKRDCIQQHNHFLCASEPFYMISTTLLERVIGQPCLQSLQGLVIIQIYVQLSGRYSTASHISGLATRLAQTLGLHRHSDRFKFDPLETELRRRAWWCQYSLDAFSSAYHGMPRLIRDQDVDTDFPTSVDHNLLSRTHVEFPLPGERSQVDTAISLFKLARIIGRTLEDLYTTTRRRGGVAKIARLQAELNMWERVVLEPELESEPATSVTTKSLEATFLRVVHCVATIHIHRPALSFTTADPQFVSSLKACGQASANLVELLSSSLGTLGTNHATGQVMMGDWPETMLVTLLYPNGIHMLWQAGLTILFTGWKGYPVTVDQDENLIQICVATLREFRRHTDDVGNHIGQCADVLELLCKKVFSELEALPDLEQLQWNIWDWPIASALELVNTLDIIPLDLNLNLYQ